MLFRSIAFWVPSSNTQRQTFKKPQQEKKKKTDIENKKVGFVTKEGRRRERNQVSLLLLLQSERESERGISERVFEREMGEKVLEDLGFKTLCG